MSYRLRQVVYIVAVLATVVAVGIVGQIAADLPAVIRFLLGAATGLAAWQLGLRRLHEWSL